MHCPRCQQAIPVKKCFLLSNNTVVTCRHCGARLQPEKMSSAAFPASFLATALPGYYMARKYNSLPKGMLMGAVIGIILYSTIVIYTYCNVKLREI
ncbi:hypothetical protein SAMN05192529_110113 [Arachidicoccus rhizosphaerae]|uniref:Uncharacterized protein n=1 Tax=Arachidicoccus rhizosphaerae TaxID=551991 RepID=A0A1H3Z9P2_9BACT|nr:hypothetical protein SAMN05192529_110113 [Arachidicoccus rhizosphaerae]